MMTVAITLLFLLCLTAMAYYCFGIYASWDGLAPSSASNPTFQPPVTILKPLCGLEWEMEQNLLSFCQQNYPQFQLVFAVQTVSDPAIAIVENLKEQFPNLGITLMVSDRAVGTNPKVNNLANALSVATYDVLVIADSDIRVGPDYLQQIVQPLQNPHVGVVTCLYRSLAKGWMAAFESVDIATQFVPRVLTAHKLEGLNFAFGSTIVIRQAVLTQIGGFEAIADYLADDYQLGYLSSQAGHQVVLSPYVVDHRLADINFRDIWHRQVRWSKCIRVGRFWGYLGLIFTQGIVMSSLLVLCSGGSWLSWVILSVAWSLRLAMAWIAGVKFMADAIARQYWWLIPLRDWVNFGIWCASFVDNTIRWRGKTFKLREDGKLVAV